MQKQLPTACEKARQRCTQNQYKECSWIDILKLWWHTAWCSGCRRWSQTNNKLSRLFQKKMYQPVTDDAKMRMRNALNEHLK